MKALRTSILLAAVSAGLACPSTQPAILAEPAVPPPALTAESFEVFADREVHEPQFVLAARGRLLVVWREKASEGSNLYVATLAETGHFAPPVRINDEAGTVGSYPLDELRAAVAAGPQDRIAVAWGDSRGQVRLAESRDGGSTFLPSRQLEQTSTPAYRSFPALAYDATGTLHAVWIDARAAADFAEEPADLYYARVTAETIAEHNLTAEQEPSVCGCCRPFIESTAAGALRIAFRNTTADGYRDIFTLTGSLEAGFGAPQPAAEPLWKLRGCPMSGPILAAGDVLWPDGSTGIKLLRRARFGSSGAAALLFDSPAEENWSPRLPPRAALASNAESTTLLLPGRDASRLLEKDAATGVWRLTAEDLPPWATSALLAGQKLWLLGAVDGRLMYLERGAR